MEKIRFPDVTAAVIGALDAQLPAMVGAAVPVSSKVPNPRPAQFIIVFRTGGPREGLVVDRAQLTVEAWAANDADAHDLAQNARAVIGGLTGTITGGVTIYDVEELSGPAFLPDPASTQSRYTYSTIVPVRGVPVA